MTQYAPSLGACTSLERIKYRVIRGIPPEIEGLVALHWKLRLDQDLDATQNAAREAQLALFHEDDEPSGDDSLFAA